MAKNAVSVKNITISYRTINPFRLRRFSDDLKYQKIDEVIAVKNVSFDLQKGKILGIIGKNGSGKSTLLKAVAGIFSPDSGMIELYGNQVSLLALGVGFISSLSGWENIYLSGMLLGFSKSYINSKEKEIIEFSELNDFIYKPIDTYSSGMRMRLAFSISIVLDSDIILVDEVLSVGDASFREKSNLKLREIIQDHNTSVIIVSHNETVMKELCDEIIWMDQGNIIERGKPSLVIKKYLEFIGERKKRRS